MADIPNDPEGREEWYILWHRSAPDGRWQPVGPPQFQSCFFPTEADALDAAWWVRSLSGLSPKSRPPDYRLHSSFDITRVVAPPRWEDPDL